VALNNTPCSPRGVRQVVFDPFHSNIVYAASYARGVWRSADDGATWVQIKASLDATTTTTLPAIAVTKVSGRARSGIRTHGYFGVTMWPPEPLSLSTSRAPTPRTMATDRLTSVGGNAGTITSS
jgi:hypothetical protein